MKPVVMLGAALLTLAFSAAPLPVATVATAQTGASQLEVVSRYTPELPANLRAKGHQGEVGLRGTVRADGELADVEVTSSSGSAELDAFAMQAFQRWRFKPARDANGAPVERKVSISLDFWADSLTNFGEKTCAEFVADIDWRRATFPDKADRDMRLYNLMGGMFLMGGPNKAFPTQDAMARAHKALPAAWSRTYEACRSRPGDRFFAVLVKELKR